MAIALFFAAQHAGIDRAAPALFMRKAQPTAPRRPQAGGGEWGNGGAGGDEGGGGEDDGEGEGGAEYEYAEKCLRALLLDLTGWLKDEELPHEVAHHLHERVSAVEHALKSPEMAGVELERSAADVAEWAAHPDIPDHLKKQMEAQAAQMTAAMGGGE